MELKIGLKKGDITDEEDTIVNAANPGLLGGGGVDGAIHCAAGPKMDEECLAIIKRIGRLEPGNAVITGGGNLKAKHVIHTVGPIWHGGKSKEEEVLRSAYLNSLRVAKENGLKKISFPSISTGAYGYPVDLAAKIAVRTVHEFLKSESEEEDMRANFVLFDDRTFEAYRRALLDLQRIERVRERAKKIAPDDPAHDFSHTERVVEMCKRLCSGADADMDVLTIAALLHDVGFKDELEHRKDHSISSAEIAETILKEEGFDENFIERVCYAIKVHRYGKKALPETIEARVLQDADRLDALGAIGIARALADRRSKRIYDPSESPGVYDPFAERSALTHMKEKLLHLKDSLHTEEAKRIAEERHRFTLLFVEELESELKGKR
jgi:O-acetyl-ADP-ribose deacetylase (regulator of RNase III)/HD superfamily phosphodiesterase